MKGKDFVLNAERQIKILGMRKDEFYKKVGITASAFSLYRSEKSFPSKDTLERTASVLGVSVASLLEPAPETKKPASVSADGVKINPHYFDLSEEDRAVVDAMIERLSKAGQ